MEIILNLPNSKISEDPTYSSTRVHLCGCGTLFNGWKKRVVGLHNDGRPWPQAVALQHGRSDAPPLPRRRRRGSSSGANPYYPISIKRVGHLLLLAYTKNTRCLQLRGQPSGCAAAHRPQRRSLPSACNPERRRAPSGGRWPASVCGRR